MKKIRDAISSNLKLIPVVQVTKIVWSKECRGGKSAVQRGKLPRIYPLNSPTEKTDYYIFDSHGYNQRRDSIKSVDYNFWIRKEHAALKYRINNIDDVRFELNSNKLVIRFGNHQLQPLERDEWLQIKYNYRFVDYHLSLWKFAEITLNIGLFANPKRTVFLELNPVKKYSLLKDLNRISYSFRSDGQR